jgi:hypothetical protein
LEEIVKRTGISYKQYENGILLWKQKNKASNSDPGTERKAAPETAIETEKSPVKKKRKWWQFWK